MILLSAAPSFRLGLQRRSARVVPRTPHANEPTPAVSISHLNGCKKDSPQNQSTAGRASAAVGALGASVSGHSATGMAGGYFRQERGRGRGDRRRPDVGRLMTGICPSPLWRKPSAPRVRWTEGVLHCKSARRRGLVWVTNGSVPYLLRRSAVPQTRDDFAAAPKMPAQCHFLPRARAARFTRSPRLRGRGGQAIR
jgi:hypothetical protein